jgi:hypothetical protein
MGTVVTRYAENTTVPIEKSRDEIERLLRREGASQFVSAWDDDKGIHTIMCRLDGRIVRFNLMAPDPSAFGLTETGRARKQDVIDKAVEQEERRQWRGLLLIIKAKFEAIEMGLTTFEREFLADLMLPDGSTVGEWIEPRLEESYARGTMPMMPKMLMPGKGK